MQSLRILKKQRTRLSNVVEKAGKTQMRRCDKFRKLDLFG